MSGQKVSIWAVSALKLSRLTLWRPSHLPLSPREARGLGLRRGYFGLGDGARPWGPWRAGTQLRTGFQPPRKSHQRLATWGTAQGCHTKPTRPTSQSQRPYLMELGRFLRTYCTKVAPAPEVPAPLVTRASGALNVGGCGGALEDHAVDAAGSARKLAPRVVDPPPVQVRFGLGLVLPACG